MKWIQTANADDGAKTISLENSDSELKCFSFFLLKKFCWKSKSIKEMSVIKTNFTFCLRRLSGKLKENEEKLKQKNVLKSMQNCF